MAVIHINGERYEVDGGENLLHTCLSLGLDVPYFCYHPALGSAGSCRQCAVKQYNNAEDEAAGRGRLVMSCTVETTDEMYISVDDEEAKAFRAAMIELLMTNHPHDCPTCEEGGNCQLQDMTYMSGHIDRKYRFTKRTHDNQYLGPFINHEANRCIACYRCVRYYKDYAGGNDLGAFASASRVFFGRTESGVLESEFAGNLTEICPTGVFTDKSHSERYNRKWDMQYSPSICQGCSIGCNISAGERYGELRRIENRYNGRINSYFLCDRGRFGYGYVNQTERPTQAKVKGQYVSASEAIAYCAEQIKQSKVIGIGSATASLESNYALKHLVGASHFYAGMSDTMLALTQTAVALTQKAKHTPSVMEVESADAILILGEDLTQTAARLALSVRQASKNKGRERAVELKTPLFMDEPVRRITQDLLSPIYIAAVSGTALDDVATQSVISDVDGIIDFAEAVILALKETLPKEDPHGVFALANEVATTLKTAKNPLIISGTSLFSAKLMMRAAEIAELIGHAGLNLIVPDVNSVGLATLATQSIDAIDFDQCDTVIVLENELTITDAIWQDRLKQKQLIVINHQPSHWVDVADVVLPAATFAEADGTVVNYQLFAQRYYPAFEPSYYHPEKTIKASWRWLSALKGQVDHDTLDWGNFDLVLNQMVHDEPQLKNAEKVAPLASFRLDHMKVAREPKRYSGRTAMRAPLNVSEPRQPQDPDSALAFSMEGYQGTNTPGPLIPFAWAAGWNSPQAWNKYIDQNGKLKHGEGGAQLDHIALTAQSLNSTTAKWQGLTIVPLYDLFASAPYRNALPLFDERQRPIYIKMTPDAARRLNYVDGTPLTILHNGQTQTATLVIDENFADDCLGVVLQHGDTLETGFSIAQGDA